MKVKWLVDEFESGRIQEVIIVGHMRRTNTNPIKEARRYLKFKRMAKWCFITGLILGIIGTLAISFVIAGLCFITAGLAILMFNEEPADVKLLASDTVEIRSCLLTLNQGDPATFDDDKLKTTSAVFIEKAKQRRNEMLSVLKSINSQSEQGKGVQRILNHGYQSGLSFYRPGLINEGTLRDLKPGG